VSYSAKIGIPVTVVGILLLVPGFLIFNNTRAFVADSLSTTGAIVDFDVQGRQANSTYHPIVEFTTDGGETVRFTVGVHENHDSPPNETVPPVETVNSNDSEFPKREVGDSVKVRYMPSDPENARVDSFFELWVMPIGPLGFAVLLAVSGGILVLIGFMNSRRKRA